MVNPKRAIAALIVCFKPHVLLTLCILLVIGHSIIIAIQRGSSNSWRATNQHDFTLTMTTLILIVALIWAAFFIFIVRFELRNELDSLLTLFQCSKRGFRLLGVVGFHVALLTLVALMVSTTVERSIPNQTDPTGFKLRDQIYNSSSGASRGYINELDVRSNKQEDLISDGSQHATSSSKPIGHDDFAFKQKTQSQIFKRHQFETGTKTIGTTVIDRKYLMTVYKIWLTAIVYAFLYLIIENIVMFYTDLSLVEFVHISFLAMVAKATGIDLSDYPAGEMLFNPLVRHRIR